MAADITTHLLESIQSYYHYRHTLPFEEASVMQVNSFGTPTTNELLQHAHEDAVFLTVISTNSPGLEGIFKDDVKPFTISPDEVLVMPGSVMTDMTGGEIQPLYHQARNHGNVNRKSIMYFVNPDIKTTIPPFIVNDENRELDIQKRIINNHQQFGLSKDFLS